jgi:beta-glucosidase-like glycosyl hydrolase
VDLEERIGVAMAREARSFGANWLAAVCVNLLRHPGWGRAQETYGEDPVLLGCLGAAMTAASSAMPLPASSISPLTRSTAPASWWTCR